MLIPSTVQALCVCYSSVIGAKFKENSAVDAAGTVRPILRVDYYIQCVTKFTAWCVFVVPFLVFFEISPEDIYE